VEFTITIPASIDVTVAILLLLLLAIFYNLFYILQNFRPIQNFILPLLFSTHISQFIGFQFHLVFLLTACGLSLNSVGIVTKYVVISLIRDNMTPFIILWYNPFETCCF
jgi:hypothetical protein